MSVNPALSTNLQVAATLALVAVGLGSIVLANALFDRGVPNYLTRKLAHVAGGLGFLISPFLFDTPLFPLLLSAVFTLTLGICHTWAPQRIRGVGGSGRAGSMAEVWYPFACGVAIAIGWGLLQNPWLGVLPTLFLGFGDAVTGAVRTLVYKRETKGIAGSIAMFAVCCVLALLAHPYWIGLAGALTATFFERITIASRRWDDNPALTISSTLVMSALYLGFVGP